MSDGSTPLNLGPKVEQALSSLAERPFADRLRQVFLAAEAAVSRLAELDMVKYEQLGDDAPDLSLWEEMAPYIRDTLMDVNALLQVIREQFLTRPAPLAGPAMEADQALRDGAQELSGEVTRLGETMRSPQVVSDRWNLLSELQGFRARFREKIGELVYASLSPFAEVSRRDVVPGYAAELKGAIAARSVGADLQRLIRARLEKIREAEREDVQWNAQQLEKELESFAKTQAYRGLWSRDKKTVLEFREALARLSPRTNLTQGELLELVEPFGEFVKTLDRINNRQILKANDREVWAAVGVKLELAEQLMAIEPEQGKGLFHEAVTLSMALYGRDAQLDAFLRKAKKTPITQLAAPDVRGSFDAFRQRIANLSMF